MKKQKSLSLDRLTVIRSKVEQIIEENRKGVGSGQDISEIEENLLTSILDIGKLLLEDRIMEEEKNLENTGYDIVGKKKRIKVNKAANM